MAHDVFISHSSNDKPTADAICAILEADGLRCWVAPRDIRPGETWAGAIFKAVGDCQTMVIILSKHANTSKHVMREVELAVKNDVVIVPFRTDDVEPAADLAFFLSSTHWLDAFTPPLETRIRELAASLKGLLKNRIRTSRGSIPSGSPSQHVAQVPLRKGPPTATVQNPPSGKTVVSEATAEEAGNPQEQALEAMPAEVSRLIEKLNSPAEKKEALLNLRSIAHPSTIPALISHLTSHDAACAIAALGHCAVPALLQALKDKKRRHWAVQALSAIKDDRAVQPLVDLLGSEDFVYVPVGLRHYGPAATTPLLAALSDERPSVRGNAAYALAGHEGQPGVVEALVLLLKDPVEEVRRQAAAALQWHRDKNAVQPLISALEDESSPVRAAACWSLKYQGDSRAVLALRKCQSDYSKQVRDTATRALGDMECDQKP